MQLTAQHSVFEGNTPQLTHLSPQERGRLPENSQFLRIEKSTCRVVHSSDKGFVQFGSGVVLTDRGLVATALHVLELDRSQRWSSNYVEAATLTEGIHTIRKLPYEIVRYSKEEDLAILQLPKQHRYHPVAFHSDEVGSGSTVLTIGNQHFKRTITIGQILFPTDSPKVIEHFKRYKSGPERSKSLARQHVAFDLLNGNVATGDILATNPIDAGDSGAPLLKNGRLVGLVTDCKRMSPVVTRSFEEVTGINLSDYEMPERLCLAKPVDKLRALASV